MSGCVDALCESVCELILARAVNWFEQIGILALLEPEISHVNVPQFGEP